MMRPIDRDVNEPHHRVMRDVHLDPSAPARDRDAVRSQPMRPAATPGRAPAWISDFCPPPKTARVATAQRSPASATSGTSRATTPVPARSASSVSPPRWAGRPGAMTRRLTPDELGDLFATCDSAWRFEGLQDYANSENDRNFHDWYHGLTPVTANTEWCDYLREATRRGARIERVRAVLEPRNSYTEWELRRYEFSAEAGERI